MALPLFCPNWPMSNWGGGVPITFTPSGRRSRATLPRT